MTNDNFTSSGGTNLNQTLTMAVSGTGQIMGYSGTCWDYWTTDYYPRVIHTSYPVYLQERAKDQGKQAFEIIKALQDKKLIKLDKVADFIEAMDTLIKIL